eukprot:scaffold83022_cov72-Phaeocystis_antarctica.AAC.1
MNITQASWYEYHPSTPSGSKTVRTSGSQNGRAGRGRGDIHTNALVKKGHPLALYRRAPHSAKLSAATTVSHAARPYIASALYSLSVGKRKLSEICTLRDATR